MLVEVMVRLPVCRLKANEQVAPDLLTLLAHLDNREMTAYSSSNRNGAIISYSLGL